MQGGVAPDNTVAAVVNTNNDGNNGTIGAHSTVSSDLFELLAQVDSLSESTDVAPLAADPVADAAFSAILANVNSAPGNATSGADDIIAGPSGVNNPDVAIVNDPPGLVTAGTSNDDEPAGGDDDEPAGGNDDEPAGGNDDEPAGGNDVEPPVLEVYSPVTPYSDFEPAVNSSFKTPGGATNASSQWSYGKVETSSPSIRRDGHGAAADRRARLPDERGCPTDAAIMAKCASPPSATRRCPASLTRSASPPATSCSSAR